MDTNEMRVILGAFSLKAYVAAPKAFRVLGLVRFGLEYGLLATNTHGQFFRVNGSQVAMLDGGSVRQAIGSAYGDDARPAAPVESKPIAAPIIMVRKHRHVDRSAAMAMS
jgi:hypothetical protein